MNPHVAEIDDSYIVRHMDTAPHHIPCMYIYSDIDLHNSPKHCRQFTLWSICSNTVIFWYAITNKLIIDCGFMASSFEVVVAFQQGEVFQTLLQLLQTLRVIFQLPYHLQSMGASLHYVSWMSL